MLCDYHVHTIYSDDSVYKMEDVIKDGIKKGINELCFTDHVDYGIKRDVDDPLGPVYLNGQPISNVDYPEYYKEYLYLKKKYKNIAIVTKSIEEAKVLLNALKNKYEKISLIDINTEKFNKQLVVAPAYGVKGLEFDSVIIINNFDYDAYLYYVAVTRCQHELIVYE